MRVAWAVLLLVSSSACAKQASESSPRAIEASVSSVRPEASTIAVAPLDVPVEAGAATPPEEPPPRVRVVSIGMHVAGGPYDEETKKPFLRAVEPRYAELARCWKHVPDPRQADAGVDLLIPAAGGRAKVSHPRSTIAGEGFLPCVVSFFESVVFEKPKSGGAQALSYSVRFAP